VKRFHDGEKIEDLRKLSFPDILHFLCLLSFLSIKNYKFQITLDKRNGKRENTVCKEKGFLNYKRGAKNERNFQIS